MNRIINRVKRVCWLFLGLIVRFFSRIKKGQILFISYQGKNYSCNPRAITEYIIENKLEEFTLYWLFSPEADISVLPPNVNVVRPHTLNYLKILYSSEFLINNQRQFLLSSYWLKKKGQKYIMTWHSSVGLKCIEGDTEQTLRLSYIRAAKFDSKQTDLILSGSAFRSEVIRRAFWYKGEILETGTPRNDVFFSQESLISKRAQVQKYFGLSDNDKIILYAPTFRKSNSLDYYKLNWNLVVEAASSKYSAEIHVLVRLHPNLLKKGLDTSSLTKYKNTHDATFYPDMHDLLCACDILITDYSSSMFDFPLTQKPVILYATDYESYDRNIYFKFNELPFAFIESEENLINFIRNFDETEYTISAQSFIEQTIGSFERGRCCSTIVEWMKIHSIS